MMARLAVLAFLPLSLGACSDAPRGGAASGSPGSPATPPGAAAPVPADPALAERDRAFAPVPPAATAPALEGREGATEKGLYRIRWTGPDPIPLNAQFGLALAATLADGSPLPASASVTVDAGMPGHGHGMTLAPRTERLGDGTFETRGMLFHMPGDWEITVRVSDGEISDGARFRASLP